VTQGERRRLQADVRRERALERRLEARVAHTRAELKPLRKVLREQGEHGRLERKRVCRTFSYCTALMRAKHNELGQFATGCPPFDKEVYGPIWEQARRPPSGGTAAS